MSSIHSPESARGTLQPSRSHIAALDGVRGIAIMLVLVMHFGLLCTAESLSGRIFQNFTKSLWVGVDLFFVLSGFLITRILLADKSKPRYFVNFYARRFLRIFPLYYAVLFVLFVAIPLLGFNHPKPILRHEQVWAWTYLINFRIAWLGNFLPSDIFNIDHFWSLAVEEQFYLIWPAVVLLLSRGQLRIVCWAMIVLSFALRAAALLAAGHPWPMVYVAMPMRMDTLCWGALVALAVTEKQESASDASAATTAQSQGSRRFFDAMLVVGLILMGVVIACVRTLDYDITISRWICLTATGPLFAGCVYRAIHVGEHGLAHRLLRNRPIRLLGKYSYGIYVFHYLTLPIAFQFIENHVNRPASGYDVGVTLLFIVCGSAANFIIAWASFTFFETPILKLKRFFHDVPGVVLHPGSDGGLEKTTG